VRFDMCLLPVTARQLLSVSPHPAPPWMPKPRSRPAPDQSRPIRC